MTVARVKQILYILVVVTVLSWLGMTGSKREVGSETDGTVVMDLLIVVVVKGEEDFCYDMFFRHPCLLMQDLW